MDVVGISDSHFPRGRTSVVTAGHTLDPHFLIPLVLAEFIASLGGTSEECPTCHIHVAFDGVGRYL